MQWFVSPTTRWINKTPAHARAAAQRNIRAARNDFSSGEGVVPPAQAAKRSSTPFTPRDSLWLETRASTRPSRLSIGLALRTLSHNKRRPSNPFKGGKIMTLVQVSGTARESESAESPCRKGGSKRSAPSAETDSTVERTQTKRQELEQEKFADLMSQSGPFWYEGNRYLGSFAVSKAF